MASKLDAASLKVLTSAKKGDAVTLRQALEAGGRCDIADDYSRGPLSLAAQHGHLNCIKVLLEYGADMEERDIEMDSPISLAAAWGHTECVRYLIEKGADVNCYSANGTPLIQAARCACAECVRLLLAKGAEANAGSSYGTTALKEAIMQQSVKCVKLLVEHGAKVSGADFFGFDEMMLAVQIENEECVRLALAAGGDPKYLGKHLEISLFDAVNDDDVPRVRELLKQGADVNFRNAAGETVLFRALQYATPCDCLSDILAAHPDETIRDAHGHTAWESAQLDGALHGTGLTVEDLRNMPFAVIEKAPSAAEDGAIS
ncbi:MAG: ankyrin repeat domain-containing protein [Akkermansia sp.]|nr:ankyrin repeat domain-containing protein [Akkermansia sp.]